MTIDVTELQREIGSLTDRLKEAKSEAFRRALGESKYVAAQQRIRRLEAELAALRKSDATAKMKGEVRKAHQDRREMADTYRQREVEVKELQKENRSLKGRIKRMEAKNGG